MSATTAARPVSPGNPANAEQTGRRIEEVLDRLAATGDPTAAAAAEELVRSLMDFYGAGLARILHLLSGAPGRASGAPLDGLLGDPLVASLLVLHDLHPEDRDTRIARALDTVHEHALEMAGFEEDSGTLTLRAPAGGCGCGTGAEAPPAAPDARACFTPEGRALDLQSAPPPPPPLQIGTGPATGTR